MSHSLRSRLLAWVVLPLAGVTLVDTWINHRDAVATASTVQDRLLLGSARMIAEELRFEDGAVQAHVPPAALELFEAGNVDRVFYRVLDGRGQAVGGYPELDTHASNLQPETPVFVDASVRGLPTRAVAYLQPVLTDSGLATVRVEVAETLVGRDALIRTLWVQSLWKQTLALALVAVLTLSGLASGLRPLLRLRDRVVARQPGTIDALEIHDTPTELVPLVSAINDYAQRLDRHSSAQQAFVQNAAHQLRTPLTLLTTQVSYALRATDDAGRQESLAAVRHTLQQSVRLVHQLLTLSAAEAHPQTASVGPVESLDAVARQVIEDMAGRAQARDIDLGFKLATADARVRGHAVMLREIAMNLVDNAIRYTQRGGIVTCRIQAASGRVELVVEDDGPGIAPELHPLVFERFSRLQDDDSDGCGLGLPIVREFAQRLGASVTLSAPATGRGLVVTVSFARV